MRKQSMVLKNIATAAAPGEEMNARGCIEVQFIVNQNASLVRTGETREAIEGQGLSRTARAQKHSDTKPGTEVNIKLERFRFRTGGKPFDQAGVDTHDVPAPSGI